MHFIDMPEHFMLELFTLHLMKILSKSKMFVFSLNLTKQNDKDHFKYIFLLQTYNLSKRHNFK